MTSSTFLLQGQEHYSQKNYLLAFEAWNKGAMQDDLDCMWKIFDFLYLDGELEFEDDGPILTYAELAAANDATRAWQLGEHYFDELQNVEKGMEWLTKAAKQHPRFAEKLGDLHAAANSLVKNITQALYWWEHAALLDGASSYNLSEKYRKGIILTKDINLSIQWTKQGAILGDERCMNQLAIANATGENIEKNEELAIFWWEKAALLNRDFAYKLGERFLSGNLVQKNEKKAVEWLQIAAKSGHVGAIQKLERLGIKLEK